jgi:hypothetical protein
MKRCDRDALDAEVKEMFLAFKKFNYRNKYSVNGLNL